MYEKEDGLEDLCSTDLKYDKELVMMLDGRGSASLLICVVSELEMNFRENDEGSLQESEKSYIVGKLVVGIYRQG
jgi:hypothetical protein